MDLKTGLSQEGPTDSQRLQLLVYCYLVGAATGDMPTRIAIEDPSGRRWEEAVRVDEIQETVARIDAARREYEAADPKDLSELAQASAETCRRCPYRVVCRPYWEALETTWEHGSVAGYVIDVECNPHGSTFTITADAPRDSVGETWLVTAVPDHVNVTSGPTTIVDAELTGAACHLRWRWSTESWPATDHDADGLA